MTGAKTKIKPNVDAPLGWNLKGLVASLGDPTLAKDGRSDKV